MVGILCIVGFSAVERTTGLNKSHRYDPKL